MNNCKIKNLTPPYFLGIQNTNGIISDRHPYIYIFYQNIYEF
jgi:hypothetical protein